ncbi:hypothetical protein D3C75_1019760 [compost metagenome]
MVTSSGSDVQLLAITGKPMAMPSSGTMAKPSQRLGTISASALRYSAWTSSGVTHGRYSTPSIGGHSTEPSFTALPTTVSFRSLRWTLAKALSNTSKPF